MKFRHTIQILIDNFSVTYKQLLYKLLIVLVVSGLSTAILHPIFKLFTNLPEYKSLIEGIRTFFTHLIEGNLDELNIGERLQSALESVKALIKSHTLYIALGIVGLVFVRILNIFLSSLGNYTAAAVINDKMAFRAQSPFFLTLVRNLKSSALYSIMYATFSFVYDATCVAVMYLLVFKALVFVPIFGQIFLFTAALVFLIALKLTLASDWLPSLIRGKKKAGAAFVYTFNRKNKKTFNVLSNFLILVLIIFSVNVFAIIFTFGVAALITIPASYMVLNCFQLVNYYDREELKYFLDKNTIIKPEKEEVLTREQFFKGEK